MVITYRSISGLSRPYFAYIACLDASGRDMVRATSGSPGAAAVRKKVAVAIRNSATSSSRNRRKMYFIISNNCLFFRVWAICSQAGVSPCLIVSESPEGYSKNPYFSI